MAKEVGLGTVQQRDRVTIPVELRRKVDIVEGRVVAFTEAENGVLISPGEVLGLDGIEKTLKEQGISVEELLESGREARGEMVEKD